MNKRVISVLLCALILSGCAAKTPDVVPENTEEAEESGKQTTSAEAEQNDEAKSEIKELLENSAERSVYANDMELQLSDEEWTELLGQFRALQETEPVFPKESGELSGRIRITINGDEHTLYRCTGKSSTFVSIDGKAEYACLSDTAALFDRYCSEESYGEIPVSESTPEDRLIGLSIECSEPKTQDEYLAAARKIVAQWLDSLKTETGRYKLESYSFTDSLADNRVFHGDGYVNGGREFVCYVGFDTPTEDESTAFFASGTYDTFYHYYFGPGVLARFRWENGVCTLIDYDEAFAMLTSDRLKNGLYGISENCMSYKTFYDFQNDSEKTAEYLAKYRKASLCGYPVSHNVMMLANGKVIYLDIGCDYPQADGDLVTDEMHDYFYSEGDYSIYSSPVDYIDGSGAVTMTYKNGFSLVFDDYNHDGNPDYTIRIAEKENGSYYDVRCMDVNGTPWEDNTEVFLEGEFAESVRLQVTENGILKPVVGENGSIVYKEERLFTDKSNTAHHDVTEGASNDYRMYSQRFYLPENSRKYTPDDGKVICYFWNNTDKSVKAGGGYEIQRLNDSLWETVSSGKQIPFTQVEAGGCAELSFDISDLSDGDSSVYRIKTNAGSEAVYGGFYMGSKEASSLEISSANYPTGTKQISFEVKNTGFSTVYPDTIELYHGDEKLCDVNTASCKQIDSGNTNVINVSEKEISGDFLAGDYRILITAGGSEFFGKASVKEVSPEKLYYFPTYVTAEKTDGGINLLLKNGIWNEEAVLVSGVYRVQFQQDDIWLDTFLTSEHEEIEIEYGKEEKLFLSDQSDFLDEMKEIFEKIASGKYDDILEERVISEVKSMTFEEYLRDIANIGVPQKGDLCRAELLLGNGETEYVYFSLP